MRGGKVIVSFTSFPARIQNVWQVVECMFRQTCRPYKIILWLSRDQFPTRESVPESLRIRENGVFEIRLVDGNIRSHKKYYYVAQEYPDSWIFLIDDDIYYPTDILERSWRAHEENPRAVIANYGYSIAYDEDGSCLSYSRWKPCHIGAKGKGLFFGSGGGTLLKPSLLYKDLTDIELALKLTPLADDIWLNAMCQLAHLDIVILPYGLLLPVESRGNITLSSVNNGESKNDEQLGRIKTYYSREERMDYHEGVFCYYK